MEAPPEEVQDAWAKAYVPFSYEAASTRFMVTRTTTTPDGVVIDTTETVVNPLAERSRVDVTITTEPAQGQGEERRYTLVRDHEIVYVLDPNASELWEKSSPEALVRVGVPKDIATPQPRPGWLSAFMPERLEDGDDGPVLSGVLESQGLVSAAGVEEELAALEFGEGPIGSAPAQAQLGEEGDLRTFRVDGSGTVMLTSGWPSEESLDWIRMTQVEARLEVLDRELDIRVPAPAEVMTTA